MKLFGKEREVKAQARGMRAQELVSDPVIQEALKATHGWAMSTFASADSPEKAWRARMRVAAVDEFTAYLLAAIQFGRAGVDELVKARDRQSDRKKEGQALADYLTEAREARAEANEKQAKVAD